jgi:hypothetical protein
MSGPMRALSLRIFAVTVIERRVERDTVGVLRELGISQRCDHFRVYVYGLQQLLLCDVFFGGVRGVNAAWAD